VASSRPPSSRPPRRSTAGVLRISARFMVSSCNQEATSRSRNGWVRFTRSSWARRSPVRRTSGSRSCGATECSSRTVSLHSMRRHSSGRVKPPSRPGSSGCNRKGRRSTWASSCSSRAFALLSTRAGSTGTRSSAASRGRGRRMRSARCWSGSCSRRRFASSSSTRTRTSSGFTTRGTASTMPCRPAIDRRQPGSSCAEARR
jgi:hypothetical protein